jgi:pimeloyl-ACP methyl ester carboxylesterase
MNARRPAMRVALAIILGLTATGCLADKVMLWPPSGPVDAGGALRRVEHGIEIWTVAPTDGREPDAYVLSFYGNGARAEWQVADDASHFAGTTFWGVNYRGYGGSEGSATLDGVAEAAMIAYDALAKEAKGRPIFAFGTSMGTTAALHVSAERDIAGLLLVNPPPLKRLVLEEHGWWNLYLLALPTALGVPRALDSEENARRTRAPAVFVTSEDDGVVPLGYQGRVVAAYGGPKEVILVPRAGHNDRPSPEVSAKIAEAVAHMMSEGQARAKSSASSVASSGSTSRDASK